MADHENLIALTTQIVSAHVAHNAVSPDELPTLIRQVYSALGAVTEPPPTLKDPAVPIKQSIRADAIVCLECGLAHQMLKRHLNTAHKLSPAQYRQKWALPSSYPLVAPNYAKVRSTLAKKIGLGRKTIARPARAVTRQAAPKKTGRASR